MISPFANRRLGRTPSSWRLNRRAIRWLRWRHEHGGSIFATVTVVPTSPGEQDISLKPSKDPPNAACGTVGVTHRTDGDRLQESARRNAIMPVDAGPHPHALPYGRITSGMMSQMYCPTSKSMSGMSDCASSGYFALYRWHSNQPKLHPMRLKPSARVDWLGPIPQSKGQRLNMRDAGLYFHGTGRVASCPQSRIVRTGNSRRSGTSGRPRRSAYRSGCSSSRRNCPRSAAPWHRSD
jgi:hypothetical protein